MMDNFIEFLYSKFLLSSGVSIDTRTIQQGDLFFALKGPNFNGNKYAKKALELGAAFAVVDEENEDSDERIVLSPMSGEAALTELAKFHRARFRGKVVGITGSNGKTTTKELVSRVLAQKYIVHATKGNLNNHLGVPLTVLQLHPQIEVAVVEMGANHIGEIAHLCEIARPDFGLITNIGEAHTETFGGIEGVLRGKSELFEFLRQTNGVPVINLEDMRLSHMKHRFVKYLDFPANDVQVLGCNPYVKMTVGSIVVDTQLIGEYNFGNLASAVAIGRAFDVEDALIAEALGGYAPDNKRSQVIEREGYNLILDAYNANPTSMMAALSNLLSMEGEKSVVLGDMKEVENSSEAHGNIGDFLSHQELELIVFVGEQMRFAFEKCRGSFWFEKAEEAGDFLKNQTIKGHVLIKASRSMRLETVAEMI